MNRFIFLFIIIFQACEGALEDHFVKIENKIEVSQIKNIDFIYLINLDHRPERLERSLRQLAPYGIVPHRVPAVYGWKLSQEACQDIGLIYTSDMRGDEWVRDYSINEKGEYDFLRKGCLSKVYFSRWMTKGAIGCAMSHLSILQDAYDSGYQMIWVLEDDFEVVANPHQLPELIENLEKEIGKEGWDLIYTDDKFDLTTNCWFLWRPDNAGYDCTKYSHYLPINEEFAEIGGRSLTHSMIINRNGMEKILEYFKERKMFLPIDHELALVPELRLFNMRKAIITNTEGSLSDTSKDSK